MTDSYYLPSLKCTPFWWDDVSWDALSSSIIPDKVDAVVVGAGYAGLNAALTLLRAGRSVIIFDAGKLNRGASTQNGGQAAGQVKPSLGDLIKSMGLERAIKLYQEGIQSLDYLDDFISKEGISCHFSRCGRLQPAYTPDDFRGMQAEARLLSKHLGIKSEVMERHQLHRELGSDYYCGAVLRPEMAAVHPALLQIGLLERVIEAGGIISENSAVTNINRTTSDFEISVSNKKIFARDVIVATNGYSGLLMPWLRRRVIPIPSQMIATESLSPELMNELIPNRRVVVDTCLLHHYFRPSPDGTRILLGGRAADINVDRNRPADHHCADLRKIFPQLETVKISHVWTGFTGYTFDFLPHLGVRNGIYYTAGFCGGGVTWAPWLGNKIAEKVMGKNQTKTVFYDQKFKTRPFYFGKPWFLPLVLAWYRLRDNFAKR